MIRCNSFYQIQCFLKFIVCDRKHKSYNQFKHYGTCIKPMAKDELLSEDEFEILKSIFMRHASNCEVCSKKIYFCSNIRDALLQQLEGEQLAK